MPYLDRSRSRAAFDEIALHVADGPSSYARAFCDGLEARGVYAHRYALGRRFVSLAHGPAEIERTLEAVRGAVEDVAA